MSRPRELPDAEFVHLLQGGAAVAADHRQAVAANQWLLHRFGASRAVILRCARLPLRLFLHTLLIVALLAISACNPGPKSQPAIAEAYVGPMSLNLRAELSLRAEVTATVQHGDRLEILERRRRFARVRTASGAEGWTDGRQLLSPRQMARLTRISTAAGRLPSQGKATPFDLLNVHIAPNREAPSFYQLKEGELVDLIGQRLAPRVPYNPDNPDIAAAEDTPVDSWSRVRVADGRAGWVLTRLTMMAIPDEVAQYAEGHYITSYFSLGTVQDNQQTKHHWLWTTISNRSLPFHFDSFRVFIWSKRRHRYETAYIERNLRGYYPVEISPAPDSDLARFSLIFAGKDGVVTRRTYEFHGARVRLISREPWELPADDPDPATQASPTPAEFRPVPSLADRVRSKWKQWFP